MVELFLRGGWVMYPLLACSILSWAVILERCWHYAIPGTQHRRIQALSEAFRRLGHRSLEVRDRALRLEASPFLRQDDRGLAVLAAVAALGPLLGLLGTVLGLVELFRSLAAAGVKPALGALVGGIWTALLTTAFGLIIAIPALAAHHTFDKFAENRARRLQEWTESLELS